MTFKALGVDENGVLAPRAETHLASTYVSRDITTIRFDQFPITLPTGLVINGAASADQITTSPAGDVYAIFWGADGNAWVGKMRPGRYTWTLFNLGALPGIPMGDMPGDGHNYLTIAVDGDGFIHIAGNAHAHDMCYVRSATANSIGNGWVAPSLPNPDPDRSGQTYPQFIVLGTGDLLLSMRQGGATTDVLGRDQVLNRYTKATQTWARLNTVLKGTPPVASPEGPYMNHFARNPTTGRIHMFFMWRPGPPVGAEGNHDLAYLYSDDDGVTWRTVAGVAQTLPVTPVTTAPKFVTGNIGALNGGGATYDPITDRPHAIWRVNGNPTHYYWNGTTWISQVAGSGGLLPLVFSTTDGRVYAIWCDGSSLRARLVYPTLAPTDFIIIPGWSMPNYQPSLDQTGQATNTLRMLISPSSLTDSGGAYGGMLTMDMTQASVDKVTARTVEARPRPVASVPVHRPVMGSGLNVYPMLPDNWYGPAGARQATPALPNDSFRGHAITAAIASAITTAAFNVVTAGSTGSTGRVVAWNLWDGTLKGFSLPVSCTTTGVKEVDLDIWMTDGETIIIGVLAQSASGAGPALTSMSSDTHEPTIGLPTSAALFSAPRNGYSLTGVTGQLTDLGAFPFNGQATAGNPAMVLILAQRIVTAPLA